MVKSKLSLFSGFVALRQLDNDKDCAMHSKSDNIEIMINDEPDEFIKELLDSCKNSYQNNLELMIGSEFVFISFIGLKMS